MSRLGFIWGASARMLDFSKQGWQGWQGCPGPAEGGVSRQLAAEVPPAA